MSPTFLRDKGMDTFAKVHAITADGILVEVKDHTYFLPYHSNPWFKEAKVEDVFNVEPVGTIGVRWDSLDVDLAIESFTNPEKYPLIAR